MTHVACSDSASRTTTDLGNAPGEIGADNFTCRWIQPKFRRSCMWQILLIRFAAAAAAAANLAAQFFFLCWQLQSCWDGRRWGEKKKKKMMMMMMSSVLLTFFCAHALRRPVSEIIFSTACFLSAISILRRFSSTPLNFEVSATILCPTAPKPAQCPVQQRNNTSRSAANLFPT